VKSGDVQLASGRWQTGEPILADLGITLPKVASASAAGDREEESMRAQSVPAGRSMTRWAAVSAALLSLAGGGALSSSLLSQSASAAGTSQCGYGSSAGNVRTCISLGSGTVSTSATVVSTGRTIRSCLRRNGARVECTRYSYVQPGGGTGNTWVAGGSVPAGTYCAVTWRLQPDGAQGKVGTVCVGFGTTVIG
jgi:hypothetical protein